MATWQIVIFLIGGWILLNTIGVSISEELKRRWKIGKYKERKIK